MVSFGPLAFAVPWALAAFAVVPVLWWLLRVTPPAPRNVRFPAIALLRQLPAQDASVARTPWWVIALRLLVLGLIILATARPLLQPDPEFPGSGPVVLVVDNGWAAARGWAQRREAMTTVLDQAERQGRSVVVVPTAPDVTGSPPAVTPPLPAVEARGIVDTMRPMPWDTERATARAALSDLRIDGATFGIWMTDGLDSREASDLATQLQRMGRVRIHLDDPGESARLLMPPAAVGDQLVAEVRRLQAGPSSTTIVRLVTQDGRLLARESVTFADGTRAATVAFRLPAKVRNQAVRLQIEGERSAGAVVLLDERWRRRPVGLVTDRSRGSVQPLLSDLHYLRQALVPFAEIREGTAQDLLSGDVAVLILADVGGLAAEEVDALDAWIKQGGMVVRFGGPRLADSPDSLLPVTLRRGDRTLGGAMSWSVPAPLAPFEDVGPFVGLAVPGDVTVARQVLAEPSFDLPERTWARLADGTPLVTGAQRGHGWVVLVHTTAGPEWSNLAMSGLFVEMLQRLVAMSVGVSGLRPGVRLTPLQVLDGFGRLGDPGNTVLPLEADDFVDQRSGPRQPPGIYGAEGNRFALNLSAGDREFDPLRSLPDGLERHGYGSSVERDLRPWLLTAAFLLVLLDFCIALGLRGLLWPARGAPAVVGLAFVSIGVAMVPAVADDAFAMKVTSETYLAYVETGDRMLDAAVRAGLQGLSEIIGQRTAVETAGAVGIDLTRDELAFFPLLYWAVPDDPEPLSPTTRERVNGFLRSGGTILFDTRAQRFGGTLGSGAAGAALQRLTTGLDIPPLEPVPPDHVLTKAFYLMQDFPGRYHGGTVWTDANAARRHDGVSSVILGGNDWAGAWALDDAGRPLFAVIPGGERQRELAYRFGVNLVMYALTGNYKADQVHVPAILERLGQ